MPTQSLKAILTAGLRQTYRAGRNEPGLLAATNVAITPNGLYPYELVVTHTDISGGSGDVPAVVLFRGPTYIVAFGSDDKVYTLTDGASAWTETDISASLLDPSNVSSTIALDCDSNQWHFAAFQQGWIATNGVQCIFSITGEGVYCDTVTYPLSVCSFRGRLFYGGLARHWLRYNSQSYSSALVGQTLDAMSDSWVGWCKISGEDILQHVWPERSISLGGGRVEDDILANGDFSSGNTGWTVDTGWTYTTGPNRMVGSSASTDLFYAITATAYTKTMYRIEVDLERTSGSVGVDVTIGGPGPTTELRGLTTLATSGNHVFYYYIDTPTAISGITFTGASFTGTLYSVSLKPVQHFDKFSTWEEQMRSLQSGFSPACEQGDVLYVKPLRDHVVAYGENFITAYSPVEVPIPTFGKMDLASYGIACRGAVAGGLDKHAFIDVRGKLRVLNNQLQMQVYDYEEWFYPAIEAGTAEIAMSYDENEDRFYITMKDATTDVVCMYLFTNSGLSKIETQIVHCLAGTRHTASSGEISGCIEDGGGDNFHLLTDWIDFGTSELKELHSLQIVGEDYTSMKARVWFLPTQNTSIVAGESYTPDNRGEIFPEQTGVAFQLELLSTDYTNVRVYDIIANFTVGGRVNAKSLVARR